MKDLNKKITLLLPATLHPKKNQELAIKSLDKLIKIFPNINLILVGDGKDKERLMGIVNALKLKKYIKFYGVADGHEMSVLYKKCDLVLVTSNVDNEGLSMTALESLYFSKMPIVSKQAGVAEIFENLNIGILFDPNLDDLVQKIKYYLQNRSKFEKMLVKGNRWVINNLNVIKYGKDTLKFYKDTLKS